MLARLVVATAPRLSNDSLMRILLPIPQHDFDPSEVAVSWQILRAAGHEVVFATPDGSRGDADPLMLSGVGLDPWRWLPCSSTCQCWGLLLRLGFSVFSSFPNLVASALSPM
jgi:hypothetical protein